jgi:hypothetical protein
MYYDMFCQMKKTLGQMDKWLEAGASFAQTKSFDGGVLVSSRLSPDQFPLSRQLQVACDTAKLGASRLTGKEAPTMADTEQTVDELRARIRTTLAYLDGFTAKDFEATGTRVVTTPRWEGKTMTGHDFFVEHMVPNFFFHATHVYAILRHNGVGVGKKDYLGALTQEPA